MLEGVVPDRMMLRKLQQPLERSTRLLWIWSNEDMRLTLSLALLLGLSGVVSLRERSASANLRAPRTIPWLPSTAASAVESLTVEHEDLVFACDAVRCKVQATYRVLASQSLGIELRFVVPLPALTTARIGNAQGRVVVVEAPALKTVIEKNAGFDYPDADRPTIYQATVRAPITVGENALTFEYVQPLGAVERAYGYFTGPGRMVQEFGYGLWPLREWRRSPGFTIDLTVGVPRNPPTRWQRWFGHVKTVGCVTTTEFTLSSPPPVVSREQQGDVFSYHAKIAGEIPIRLDCSIGDDDLVAR
jgi:hypothetical protein